VHEKHRHQQHLANRDQQRDHHAKITEVYECYQGSDYRGYQQRKQNQRIRLYRINVFVCVSSHGYFGK
jgi:hypothetical protein